MSEESNPAIESPRDLWQRIGAATNRAIELDAIGEFDAAEEQRDLARSLSRRHRETMGRTSE